MYEFLDWTVQDVMSQPVTLPPTATLAEAEMLFEQHNYNTVPVADDTGRLLGLLTSLDLLRAFDFSEDVILPAFDQVMAQPISEFMTRDVQIVRPRTPLTRVVRKLVESRNRSFPVVEDEHVIGIIARKDVMNALRRGIRGEKPWASRP